MQKQEFEERIERTVTDEQYKVIEEVYTWHPSILNTSGKDEVAELYKSFGMTIFHAKVVSVRQNGELYEATIKILDKNKQPDIRFPEVPKVKTDIPVRKNEIVAIVLMYGECKPYIIGRCF